MAKLLIVVDMQNDFVTGALANQSAQDIIPRIRKEIEASPRVVYTRDTHSPGYESTLEGKVIPPHCMYDTKGWEVIDEFKPCYYPGKTFVYLDKSTFGFNWAKANFLVTDVDEAVFVGTCTDICVISNVLAFRAVYPEVPITVIASACAGTTPENHKAALDVMKSCLINIVED